MKIISFCLFGQKERYTRVLLCNATLARNLYPGWTVVVYADDAEDPAMLRSLEKKGALVVPSGRSPDYRGLFWRHKAVNIPNASEIVFRDADSLLTPRDKAVVDAWLASGKTVYTCRDHPSHRSPIMAGIWGVRGDSIGRLSFIGSHLPERVLQKSADERFLGQRVYPKIRNDLVVFSDFPGLYDELPVPPPVIRANHFDFLGRMDRAEPKGGADERIKTYWLEDYFSKNMFMKSSRGT